MIEGGTPLVQVHIRCSPFRIAMLHGRIARCRERGPRLRARHRPLKAGKAGNLPVPK
ncbi:hypothetical protein BC826DRAFT_1005275 [Russula brevipes]|nr:hypothetical protein BC826DRAFT_1005275 [Russula brevipes]